MDTNNENVLKGGRELIILEHFKVLNRGGYRLLN